MSVRTTMLILVLNEFPTFTITRLSITLLIFQNVVERSKPFPKAKLTKIFKNEGVTEKENQSNILRNEKDWLLLHRNI